MINIIFYIISAFIILGALGTTLSKNPVYAVLWLIFTFLNSACIFVILNAEFLAIAVVLVYVGALSVIFLFIVMLVNIKASLSKTKGGRFFALSILLVAIFIGEVVFLLKNSFALKINAVNTGSANLNSLNGLGIYLYNNYYYIFLLVGVILTLVAIGVLLISKTNDINNNHKQNMLKQSNKSSKDAVVLVKVDSKEGLK